MFCEAVKQENHRHDDNHERDHHPGEFFDAFVERRIRLLAGKAAGHFSEISLRASGDDDAGGRAAFHARAEKTSVRVFDALDVGARVARVGFFHGQGFAGQRGLDDEQIFRGNQAHVAGNHVASGEFHHVAGHEVAQRNFLRLTVAQRGRGDFNHRLEFRGGGVGLGFLDETQGQSEHNHREHHGAADVIAGFIRRRECDDGEQRKQNDQWVERGDIKPVKPTVMFFFGDLVRAKFFQPRRRFIFGQAVGRGAVQLQDFGYFLGRGLIDEFCATGQIGKI